MDADRDTRPGFSRPRDSIGAAYHNHAQAEGIFLGAGAERRNGAGSFSRKSAAPTPPAEPTVNGSSDVNPAELHALLDASEPQAFDAAWDAFVARHSRLLLHVARKRVPATEGVMDAYAHLLERLRRDGCSALRGYSPDGRSQFATWLVVVASRMCVDFHRQKYGRQRGEASTPLALAERAARRRLAGFAGVDDALGQIADEGNGPDTALRNGQLHAALDEAVAALSPDDRLLLKLRFHDDLSAQRIARVLALPSPFHVYRRLKSVCGELRTRLIKRGIEDSTP